MFFLSVLLCASILSLILTRFAIPLGNALGLVDRPGGRRQHSGIIPRTGGLALAGAFILTILLTLIFPRIAPEPLASLVPPRNDPNEIYRLTALLVGAAFCAIFGYLDDRFHWSSFPQYATQVGAGVIAIIGLIILKHVNNPLGEGLLGGPDGLAWWIVWPLTIFWFVGMMNTINFLDGLNGLVAGVTAIFCIILAVHMVLRAEEPQLSVAILPIALLGVTLGFLPFNFAPARIFMGSSGSYFLGFVVAALGIIGGARVAAVMLVLGLPILDVAWLIIQRTRSGRSVSEGGRDHLHFRLLDLGICEQIIVFSYWGFCAIFGILTLLLDDRLYKLVALGGLGLVGILVLVWASRGED